MEEMGDQNLRGASLVRIKSDPAKLTAEGELSQEEG